MKYTLEVIRISGWDVVSIENFLQIALALLKGECRPAYLTRMTLEQQVRSMMLDEEQ